MATIVLSAAGAGIGAGLGGSVLGLSGATLGRTVGAAIGRHLDQRLLGQGSEPVEIGRVDRYRIQGASDGAPVPKVFGTMRVPGHVIWSSRFKEHARSSGGMGKGGTATGAGSTEYGYTVSLALGLCEGEIARVGRIWADGREIRPGKLNMRVYRGDDQQLPDPKIEAIEGAGNVPAYRGLAYVVIEDLDLGSYGNRVPQFGFEVFRPGQAGSSEISQMVRGVALIPGTGEYALATRPVRFDHGLGRKVAANMHSSSGQPDILESLDMLENDAPNCGSVALVVSWFCGDLRCGSAEVRPKVDQKTHDGIQMPWEVAGETRATAALLPLEDGRAVYGGTPADDSVIDALQELKSRGKKAVFYPFILMDQLAGNNLPDPWTGAPSQPNLPWRGRVTLSVAPGEQGSPDRTAVADAEVAAFFGTASPADFAITGGRVTYGGPAEWTYRRMILHYAHLCAAAGGVDAFCIGSELRGLTRIRGAGDQFPAVQALAQLAADVREVLGPGSKIGYAADWSEYFGYHPTDGTGDLYFNLDPLWASPDIDFIGIDNYMPIADWRETPGHADAGHGSIYDLDYLRSNIEGGEGYDWYYASSADADSQTRTPIADGAFGEDWVYRYKDLRSWWSNPHLERQGGIRSSVPTAWVPQSKPIWFTEIGCAAVDKGANEPNRFVDAKSAESGLPRYSNGTRDDLMTIQYLRAQLGYWGDPENNPISGVYGSEMVDCDRIHVWAWDARPFPAFPNDQESWSDGANHATGHWLNGRLELRTLGGVIDEICSEAGLGNVDTSGVFGLVSGYLGPGVPTARGLLQPLLQAHFVDVSEHDGVVRFSMKQAVDTVPLGDGEIVVDADGMRGPVIEREAASVIPDRVRLGSFDAGSDYEFAFVDAASQSADTPVTASAELPMTLGKADAKEIAAKWLAQARIAQERVTLGLPPSMSYLGPGNAISLGTQLNGKVYRIDRVTRSGSIVAEATRVDPNSYGRFSASAERPLVRPVIQPAPVSYFFLDIPLLDPTSSEELTYVAATADPWPGGVNIFASDSDANYSLAATLGKAATVGTLIDPMPAFLPAVIDRGTEVRVELVSGELNSCSVSEMLNGRNIAAIGDGSPDNWEIIQFSKAQVLDVRTFAISMRLRGQLGTDALASRSWPEGSYFVLLDEAVEQSLVAAGLARHYRVGPFDHGYASETYQHSVEFFRGNGRRPFAPVHLRAERTPTGDIHVSWIRRSRVGGDNWSGFDVPLGEESEAYVVRVEAGGQLVREAQTLSADWTYTTAEQVTDGVGGTITVHVAQISASYGPGFFRKVQINV